jgi:hypothetical protein
MKIRILNVAQVEFNEAKEYYEIEQTGLGKKFEADIKEGIKRISQFPNAWPLERSEIRRYFLHKFPYKILYSIQNKGIIILAFAHLHREPNYWEERIKDT